MFWRIALSLVLAILASGAALPVLAQTAGAPTVMVVNDPTHGRILTDARGMVLYMFSNDTKGVANCYDTCKTRWPVLKPPTGAPTGSADINGKLGVISRRDGDMQVTYNDIPLYYWFQDEKPGETKGQGVGGNWWIVPVGTTEIKAAVAAPAPAASPAAGASAGTAAQAAPVAQPSPAAKPAGAPAAGPSPQALPRAGGAAGDPTSLALLFGGIGAALSALGTVALTRRSRRPQ